MRTSIEGVLADYAVQEAKRRRFLETAAAIVAAAPPSVDDALFGLTLPSLETHSRRAFLSQVDQVLRDAAR
ncbi:hypothetical protein ABZ816_08290 [Actinosynnema sp. NPDC047251]|uniref:Uncharacterized protein n=1 Tax=Saccharothrix espanaensis (strain ATCC 51144 / DSM 44229 / JCM 9112 / NBRC 15066 / NRRL 15764) TaxID=1179773 RepID=K0JRX2_SACES|nr:hypothetical protein [Saccharothrix espanaensis]CCH27544.1 hypothetical protein BN6_02110 [Saccharothrix espanaensis DSM 44229]